MSQLKSERVAVEARLTELTNSMSSLESEKLALDKAASYWKQRHSREKAEAASKHR